MESTVFFPLRSNARSLVTGASLGTVRRRLKTASLLHDEVVVEAGMLDIQAGDRGSMTIEVPENSRRWDWQTTVERGKLQGGHFSASFVPHGSNTSTALIPSSRTAIAWRPTFEPFKVEVSRPYPWLHFEFVDLTTDGKSAARSVAQVVWPWTPESLPTFARKVISDGLSRDLVVATGWTISVDLFHSAAVRGAIGAGRAAPILGRRALSVAFPSVGTLPWEAIDRLRRVKGWEEYRYLLAEVEAEARTSSLPPAELNTEIMRLYSAKLSHALERATKGWNGPWTDAVSLVTGSVGLIEPITGAVGTVAGGVATVLGSRSNEKWTAFDRALRKVSSRSR